MRKFLLTFLAFVSVNVFAQIHRSVTYDFSNPLGLTPSVTPISAGDGRVRIDEKSDFGSLKFKEGEILVTFSHNDEVIGVSIFTPSSGKTVLEINRGNKMTVSTVDEATINSIYFSGDSFLGDLTPIKADESKGEWKYTSKVWMVNSGKSVNSLAFWNTGDATEIKKMTVEYTLPIVTLVPVANIKDNDVLSSFKDMALTFEKDMNVLDASKITVAGGNKFSKVMTATAEKNVVTLSLDEAIETDGTYTVTVPAGCLEDAEGFQNKKLVYVFKVEIPKNTFNFESVLPEQGNVEVVSDGIMLTFPESVGHVDSDINFLMYYENGDSKTPKLPMYADKVLENGKAVVLKFNNDIKEEFTDKGTYTIEIPEKVVYNAFYNIKGYESMMRYNPAFTLTYTIGADKPDEPDVPEDSQVMKDAKALLEKVGVGYPAEDSDARIELDALTKATEVPTDEALKDAMDKFYAEKDVTMPGDADKYYIISNVNTKGDVVYLAYGNDMVTLTKDRKCAALFTAKLTEKSNVIFQTLDGKFLHVLIAENKFDQTTTANVTIEYNAAVNDLTLAKLSVDGANNEDLFGKFSIYGYLGKNIDNDEDVSAYVVVRHRNTTVATGASNDVSIKFDENLSSAFVIEETEPEKVEIVELAAELTPSVVARNTEKLTLKFTSDAPVVMANTSAAYFNDKDGKKVDGATISAVEGKDKEFTVSLDGLADGTYTLVIPEAMFTTEKDGKTANVAAVEKTFTIDISEADAFIENFSMQIYNYDPDKLYFDTDLNDFILFKSTPICVDETKDVHLVYKYIDNVIRVGHMVPLTTLKDEPNACKLVFDEPIKSGDLAAGQYVIILDAATVGDENFGKYLADRTSVKKSDCYVNSKLTIAFDVDNDKATAIIDLNADDNAEKVIYTISGRRVKNMTAPGIYIVNGKKVIKK